MKLLCSYILVFAVAIAVAPSAFAVSTATYQQTLNVQDLGYVDVGGELNWSHVFAPLPDRVITSIDSVSLSVTLRDDSVCPRLWQCLGDRLWGGEDAAILVNDIPWMEDRATLSILNGEITQLADLLAYDGIVNVTARSLKGDFDVVESSLIVEYSYRALDEAPPPDPGTGGDGSGSGDGTGTGGGDGSGGGGSGGGGMAGGGGSDGGGGGSGGSGGGDGPSGGGDPVNSVPEPTAALLFSLAMAGIGLRLRLEARATR